MTRLTLSDGSSWPRPPLESDDEYGVENRLRYTPISNLTAEDLMEAASIVSAYNYLVLGSTREKRDLVCREIREQLKGE